MQKSKVNTDGIPVCAGMAKRQKAKVGRIEAPAHFQVNKNPAGFAF
jgi:hypothetical protein